MKNTGVILILFICLLIISGCAKEIVCNKPYMRIGLSCCLDKNNNNICDKDEVITKKITEPGIESNPEKILPIEKPDVIQTSSDYITDLPSMNNENTPPQDINCNSICEREESCQKDCPSSCGDGICDFENNECLTCEKLGDCMVLNSKGFLTEAFMTDEKTKTCKPIYGRFGEKYLIYFFNPHHPEIERISSDVLAKRKFLSEKEYSTLEYLSIAHKEVISLLEYDSDRSEGAYTLDDTLRLKTGQCDNYAYVLMSLFDNILNEKGLANITHYELKDVHSATKNGEAGGHHMVVLEIGDSSQTSIQYVYDSTSYAEWVFEGDEKESGWEEILKEYDLEAKVSILGTLNKLYYGDKYGNPIVVPNIFIGVR